MQALNIFYMHNLCLVNEFICGPVTYGAFIRYPKKLNTESNLLNYFSCYFFKVILENSSVSKIKSVMIPDANKLS
jgi:hypothetical protein